MLRKAQDLRADAGQVPTARSQADTATVPNVQFIVELDSKAEDRLQ